MSYLVLVLLAYALTLVAFGRVIAGQLPSVKRFYRIRQVLQDRLISFSSYSTSTELLSFTNDEFKDIAVHTVIEGVDLKHKSVGEIVDAVHGRHRSFTTTIDELRAQAFILFFLGIMGCGEFLKENEYHFQLGKFVEWLDRHPLDMLGFLEAVMMVVLTAQLYNQVRTIRNFIDH